MSRPQYKRLNGVVTAAFAPEISAVDVKARFVNSRSLSTGTGMWRVPRMSQSYVALETKRTARRYSDGVSPPGPAVGDGSNGFTPTEKGAAVRARSFNQHRPVVLIQLP